MHSASVNYYSVLGVSTNAPIAEIKQKYRDLSKKYHPDTLGGDTKRMTLINEAYRVLSNPKLRSEYQPPIKAPKRAEATPNRYEKSPTKQPRYATVKRKTYAAQPAEKENIWAVFFSYLLAVPLAILIVSLGLPLLQKVLPKNEVIYFNPQAAEQVKVVKTAEEKPAPAVNTAPKPTQTTPQTTTPTGSTPQDQPASTDQSSIYYSSTTDETPVN